MKSPNIFPAEPLAAPAAIVQKGRCRFSVLSSQLVRCEFVANGSFEDRATLAVVNRRTPVPEFSVSESDTGLTIKTPHFTLTCTDTSQRFSRETLSAEFSLSGPKAPRGGWRYGDAQSGNLGGTACTLDGCDGGWGLAWINSELVPDLKKPLKIEPGLLSRDGWALVEDTNTVALEHNAIAKQLWCTPRAQGERQDFYLFLHGRDYKAALFDAALLFGRQPLPPRFAFGYWFCRYWAYTDRELEELVESHDAYGIPLDTLVIDMDWHQLGWTGYTWSKELFPDYQETLQFVKQRGLKISLNLHPADGVSKGEERYLEFRKVMGEANAKKAQVQEGRIPFNCTDPNYMRAYFSVLHHPQERAGVDVWWMDWQQGQVCQIEGLDPLTWLNYIHFEDQKRQRPDARPLVFTRYGGVGSGRQPIGFSGDTTATWNSLAYQPGFTARAANVLFGHWSHDIGGHFSLPAPELYVRWLQWGAHSPHLRTHSTKSPGNDRRVYTLAEPFRKIAVEAIRRRYELVPYISNEWRSRVETGQSLLSPMYHEHPEMDDAYRAEGQYYFGSRMIVAPVVTPVDPDDEQARFKVWLPEGSWLETATGSGLTAGWHERCALIDEVPVYLRPGTIIPGLFAASRLNARSYAHLLVDVWAGADGSYSLIEDDGESLGYTRGEEAHILLSQNEARGTRVLTIAKAKGSFPGFEKKRFLSVRVHLAAPPSAVEVGKQKLPFSHRPAVGHFSYDGDTVTTLIHVGEIDLTRETRITLRERPLAKMALDGVPGLLRRLRRAQQLTLEVSYWRTVHPEERLCAELGQTGNRISRKPETIVEELNQLGLTLPRLERVLGEHQNILAVMQEMNERPKANQVARARRIIASAGRAFTREK